VNHLLEPGDRITGISNYLFFLLEALLRRGDYRYVLATSWTREALPEPLVDHPALDVRTYPFVASQPANLWRQAATIRALAAASGARLHFNPNPVGTIAGGVPLVHTVHDLYFDVAPENYRWRHRLWWRLFFAMSSRAARGIIAVSRQTRADLVRHHPHTAEKTLVIHEASGLRPAGAAPGLAVREKAGLFVGNISPNKGIGTLVEAMDRLAAKNVSIPVFHVGRDDGNAIGTALARSTSGARPQALGRLTEAALCERYRAARFLAFPSTYEGFGLPVLEAQQFGVPVIASDLPVLREVAGEGALFVPPGDAEGFAAAMERICADDALWVRLSRAAEANAARFSWARAAAETAGLFDAILADQDRRAPSRPSATPVGESSR
jgi:glycosyltransferase involved in cell wall biosynthesis